MSKTFDPVTEGYISYLEEVRKLKARTLTDMRCSWNGLRSYINQYHTGKEMWGLSLEEYIGWVGQQRNSGKSVQSISKQISHVRGLLEYAWQSGRIRMNVLDGFNIKDNTRNKKPPVLSEEQAQRLLQSCETATPYDRQQRLIVLLYYGCGLRTQELCNLNVQDIDREKRELMITGKGEIQRRVPVGDGVWSELTDWLLERGGKRGPLFKTHVKRVRINSRDAGRMASEAALRAGLGTGVTPKTLRHSFASHLMNAGVDVGVISQLMGHRSPRETGIYLHASSKNNNEAISNLSIPHSTDKENQ